MNDTMKMYLRVFEGKSDYIPLIVKVAGGKPPHTQWESSHDPKLAIDDFFTRCSSTMKVKSDWIPNLESNFIQSLIGSFWGAKKFNANDGSLDIMPILYSSHQGAYGDIDTDNEDMAFALQHLEYLKNNIPDGVTPTMTRFLSPLDNAVVMRGGEFYLELLSEPKAAMDFLMRITNITIETALKFKKQLNDQLKRSVTNRGIYFPGIRLSGDAIVNLSPDMIKSIIYPLFDKIAEVFGSVMLHYCCTPAPSGHVVPALSDCKSVTAVDNWQGYHTFFDNNETGIAQTHTAVMTDLSSDIVSNPKTLMKDNPFFSDVPRKNGRAIVVTTAVTSIDEGQSIYDNWRNYFKNNGMSAFD